MMVWNCDPAVSRLGGFQDDVAADLVYLRILPLAAQEISQASTGDGARNSCHKEDFVADKVKANSLGPGPIEKECRGRLQHVLAQFVPRVPFGEDAFREAFGAVPAIGFLNHLEDQLSHTSMTRYEFG